MRDICSYNFFAGKTDRENKKTPIFILMFVRGNRKNVATGKYSILQYVSVLCSIRKNSYLHNFNNNPNPEIGDVCKCKV